MIKSLIRATGVAAGLILLLAACGGDDDADAEGVPPGAAESPDSQPVDDHDADEPSGLTGCELLSADELAAVVGNPIIEATDLGGAGCNYEGSDLGDVYASFTTIDAAEGDATMICEASLTAFTEYEPVSELGDHAYLETQLAGLEYAPGKRQVTAAVLACTERTVVSLALTGGRGEEELGQMAVDLTRTILERI